MQAAFAGVLVVALFVVLQPALGAKPPASASVPDHVALPDVPTPHVPHVPDLPPVVPDPPAIPPAADPTGLIHDTVDAVTGGGDPAPADPPAANTADPPAPAPTPTPAGGSSSSSPPPVSNGTTPQAGGGGAAPTTAGPARPGATGPRSSPAAVARPQFAATGLRALRGKPDFSAASDDSPTLAGQLGNVIAALPTGILIGILGMAALALLMTGRSAWFARATDRLKLQRSELAEDVGVLQAALVPSIPPELAGAAVAVAYRPAAGPAAGGDFHDVFELEDGRLGIVVGDVSGHGPEALPSTAITHFTIRAYLEAGLEPRAALRLADRALSGSMGGHFATALAAVYDPDTDRLTYASAGHPAPLVIAGHAHESIDALSAPPIGLGPAAGSRQTTCTVGPGGSVWFFTDGLTEVIASGGTMLGREGLAAMLAEAPEPRELLDRIAAAGVAGDDMTACNIAPGGAFAERAVIEEVEVGPDVEPQTLREFVSACGVPDGESERILARCTGQTEGAEGITILRIERRGDEVTWRARAKRGTARRGGARARGALGEVVRI